MENKYLHLLQDTENIGFESLRELMSLYPWFSVLHVVWLLKHKKEKPDLFPYELKRHVIYLRDREQFYNILNTDIWHQLILDIPVDDNFTEENQKTGEMSGEYQKELLEFSYEAAEDLTTTEEKGTSDEKGETESVENRNNKGFTDWITQQSSDENSEEDLIEKFLETDPGPIRPDSDTLLKGDISKKSVEENESFITDTLARIYIKQGLYSKAIFAYEKLSLKYPEKSVYFATQIEEIKKIISKN